MKKYYQMVTKGKKAEVTIYGDITSWPWMESDVSSFMLSKQIAGLDVDEIHVYINSYGGEVAEGLAIYNELRRHKAKVYTYCDGFACSSAANVFMAGDIRVMGAASLLMIHNASTVARGNAEQLRKAAYDIATITEASVEAYMKCVKIEKKDLQRMMDDETWILPEDAVHMGFATEIADGDEASIASQSALQLVIERLISSQNQTVEPGGIDPDTIADKVVQRLEAILESRNELEESENQSAGILQFFKALSQEGRWNEK